METKDRNSSRPVFIYLDNSNIFISAQNVAEEREGFEARFRLRIHFENLYEFARADRKVASAFAAGSIPPEVAALWNRLENLGVTVALQQRGEFSHSEQGVDAAIQLRMLEDALDNNGHPGIIVLLIGDGSGFNTGTGFHKTLERLKKRNWGIEVLAWEHSCKKAMKDWAKEFGKFIALDNYYEQITYLELPRAGQSHAEPRYVSPLNLAGRETIQ